MNSTISRSVSVGAVAVTVVTVVTMAGVAIMDYTQGMPGAGAHTADIIIIVVITEAAGAARCLVSRRSASTPTQKDMSLLEPSLSSFRTLAINSA